ncbi:hypothetical protein L345_01646, partial [Ophiophagus hannah]
MLIGCCCCFHTTMPEATHSNQPPSSTWKVPMAPSRTGPNNAGLVTEKCPCFTQTLVKLFSLDLTFLDTIPFSAQKHVGERMQDLRKTASEKKVATFLPCGSACSGTLERKGPRNYGDPKGLRAEHEIFQWVRGGLGWPVLALAPSTPPPHKSSSSSGTSCALNNLCIQLTSALGKAEGAYSCPEASKAYEKLQRASVRRSKAQVNGNSPETVLKIICLGKRRGWRNLSLKPSFNAYRMRWRRELAPVHPTDALKVVEGKASMKRLSFRKEN